MSPLAKQPLVPIGENPRNLRKDHRPRKPTDIKICDLILSRIHLPTQTEGSLFASATAPCVVIPGSNVGKNDENYFMMPRRRQPVLIAARRLVRSGKYFPIGLNRCDRYNWINALMQFLLFIPSLRELFIYTPQSLYPFNGFIHQYFLDVKENQPVSRASSWDLIRCLLGKFPELFHGIGVANLFETIRVISRSACAATSLDDAGFRPEWQILWDPNQEISFQKIFERSPDPSELLIGLLPLYDPALQKKPQSLFCHALRRQYFSSNHSACYEIDTFIEHRADDAEKPGDYFTYIKTDSVWVQCADERILPLQRSTQLELPLRRSILFHYRRVSIGQNFGITTFF